MYLAIGVHYAVGMTWSLGVKKIDPQEIAMILARHNGGRWPDEILVVKNDLVCNHWNLDKEYKK